MGKLNYTEGRNQASVLHNVAFVREQNHNDHRGIINGLRVGYISGTRMIAEGSSYNDLLPKWKGLSVEDLIGGVISEKGKCRVLDVGCDPGQFLLDSKLRWGEAVECVGVTASLDRALVRIGIEETDLPDGELMRKYGVDIRIADAQRLRDEFPPERFDLATGVWIAWCLDDPWALLQGMYDVLTPGGVGLVYQFNPLLVDGEQLKVETAIRKKAQIYDNPINGWDIAFEKETDKFRWPVNRLIVGKNRVSPFRFVHQPI